MSFLKIRFKAEGGRYWLFIMKNSPISASNMFQLPPRCPATPLLQSMTHDNFTKKHASLPQFKRLCERTIRVARDGQQLAPRSGKDCFYYRLFENFADILKRQHDQILDIKESMENLQDLYEFRQKYISGKHFQTIQRTTSYTVS